MIAAVVVGVDKKKDASVDIHEKFCSRKKKNPTRSSSSLSWLLPGGDSIGHGHHHHRQQTVRVSTTSTIKTTTMIVIVSKLRRILRQLLLMMMMIIGSSMPTIVTTTTTILLGTTDAFVIPTTTSIRTIPGGGVNERRAFHPSNRWRRTKQRISTKCHAVFTKFSDECLRALQVANIYATTTKTTTIPEYLEETHVFFGLSYYPGRTESWWKTHGFTSHRLQSILDSYATATSASSSSSSSDATSSPNPSSVRLSSFKQRRNGKPKILPYSKTLQEYFIRAATIMEDMGDTTIAPEHLILSLLHYQEVVSTTDNDSVEIHAATRGDDCQVMELLYNIDATLEGDEICHQLLEILYQQEEEEQQLTAFPKGNTNSEPKATMGSATTASTLGTTSSLSSSFSSSSSNSGTQSFSYVKEFGFDMTQAARNGEYDRMYGRQTEMESCWRILLRRRKNNVVLIGQAGVVRICVIASML
jgi:hypothetical protein